MNKPLLASVNGYHINNNSLKRQTIREDGTQSHGPQHIRSEYVRKAAGLPAPKEDVMTEQAATTGGLKWGGRIASAIAIALSILMLTVPVLAAAQTVDSTNFRVIDGNAWLIEVFSTVSVYTIDPETDERLAVEPAISMTYPKDPIKMELDPGIYEFAVGMSHLAKEVIYFRFEIVEDSELLTIDLREIDLPEELAVY